jgi:hypothetical protein
MEERVETPFYPARGINAGTAGWEGIIARVERLANEFARVRENSEFVRFPKRQARPVWPDAARSAPLYSAMIPLGPVIPIMGDR